MSKHTFGDWRDQFLADNEGNWEIQAFGDKCKEEVAGLRAALDSELRNRHAVTDDDSHDLKQAFESYAFSQSHDSFGQPLVTTSNGHANASNGAMATVEKPKVKRRANTLRRRVYEFMVNKGKPMKIGDIARALNLKIKSIQNIIYQLNLDGSVVTTAPGMYKAVQP